MPLTLDLPTVRFLAREVVGRVDQDFRYISPGAFDRTCYYTPQPGKFDGDDPKSFTGCVVGEIAKLAGYDLSNVETTAALNTGFDSSVTATVVRGALGNPDSKAIGYLSTLQSHQDRGDTWHKCLEYAEEFAQENGWINV